MFGIEKKVYEQCFMSSNEVVYVPKYLNFVLNVRDDGENVENISEIIFLPTWKTIYQILYDMTLVIRST